MVIPQSPGEATTHAFNLIQILLRLAVFPGLNKASLLFFWKLLEALGPSHSFKSAHGISSWFMCSELWKGVHIQLEGLLLPILDVFILITGTQLIRVGIQEQEKSICFACFWWFSLKFCNVQWVAELALKDGWLKLVAHCNIAKLWYVLSKQTALSLVGAEGYKCRRRHIAFLVRGEVDWV